MDTRAKHAVPMHEQRDFIAKNTLLSQVPLVPEIRIHTATAVTPIWNATEAFLSQHGLGIPFWCVPWAGGQALARWVLDHPAEIRGRRVVDFGSGSGLVAIAAAMGGASVRAVDIDPFAVAATALNAEANNVEVNVEHVDLTDQPIGADVLLAGDVWYERAPAERFYRWFRSLGIRIITGDPGRSYVPLDAVELARYEVPTTLDLESKTSLLTRVLTL